MIVSRCIFYGLVIEYFPITWLAHALEPTMMRMRSSFAAFNRDMPFVVVVVCLFFSLPSVLSVYYYYCYVLCVFFGCAQVSIDGCVLYLCRRFSRCSALLWFLSRALKAVAAATTNSSWYTGWFESTSYWEIGAIVYVCLVHSFYTIFAVMVAVADFFVFFFLFFCVKPFVCVRTKTTSEIILWMLTF